ncbi:MAG: hypothetical protein MK078_00045 [Crocinitomicaceae bacterium]|nr:hypothetical protein [Crocinitomicaceae bacterium]
MCFSWCFWGDDSYKEVAIIGNIEGASCIAKEHGQGEFYSPHFKSQEAADEALQDYLDRGLSNTTVLIYFQGQYYTPSEYALIAE